MIYNLNLLLECLDSPHNNYINKSILKHLSITPEAIPFLKEATSLKYITCQGCDEYCADMPVHKDNGKLHTICNKPQNYGKITISPEEIKQWRLDLPTLAGLLSDALNTSGITEIISGRVCDVGVFEGHNLFLVKGITWDDAQGILKDRRISMGNSIIITLSPPPEDIAHKLVWAGQLLAVNDNGISVDKDKLICFLPNNSTRSSTAQQSKGGKVKNKKTNDIKFKIVKPMFHNRILIKGTSVRQKADKINDVLSALTEMNDNEISDIAREYSLDTADLQNALSYFSDDKSERIYKWCLVFDKEPA